MPKKSGKGLEGGWNSPSTRAALESLSARLKESEAQKKTSLPPDTSIDPISGERWALSLIRPGVPNRLVNSPEATAEVERIQKLMDAGEDFATISAGVKKIPIRQQPEVLPTLARTTPDAIVDQPVSPNLPSSDKEETEAHEIWNRGQSAMPNDPSVPEAVKAAIRKEFPPPPKSLREQIEPSDTKIDVESPATWKEREQNAKFNSSEHLSPREWQNAEKDIFEIPPEWETPDTRKTWKDEMKGLLEKFPNLKGTGERFQKLGSYLSERAGFLSENLGKVIKKPYEMVSGLGKKMREGGVSGVEKAKAFSKYLSSRDVNLKEKAKALGKGAGEGLMKTGEWYRKLPLKYKLAISAGLISGAIVSGGGGILLPAIGAAKLGQRGMASLGMYTLTEGLLEKNLAKREIKHGFERDWLESVGKHGLATLAALAVFMGVPGAAIKEGFQAVGGDEVVKGVYNWMFGASVEHVASGAADSVGVEMHPPVGMPEQFAPADATSPDVAPAEPAPEVATPEPAAPAGPPPEAGAAGALPPEPESEPVVFETGQEAGSTIPLPENDIHVSIGKGEGTDALFQHLKQELQEHYGYTAANAPPEFKHILTTHPNVLSRSYDLLEQSKHMHVGDTLTLDHEGNLHLHTGGAGGSDQILEVKAEGAEVFATEPAPLPDTVEQPVVAHDDIPSRANEWRLAHPEVGDAPLAVDASGNIVGPTAVVPGYEDMQTSVEATAPDVSSGGGEAISGMNPENGGALLPIESNFGLKVNPIESHVYSSPSSSGDKAIAFGRDFSHRFLDAQTYAKKFPGITVFLEADKPVLDNGVLKPWTMRVLVDPGTNTLRADPAPISREFLGTPDPKGFKAVLQ